MRDKCFCCNGEFKLKYNLDKYRLLKCKTCGSAFIFPRLTDDEVEATYTEEYFSDSYYKDYLETGKPYMERIFKQLKSEGIVKPAREMLDIGCASGYLLYLMKNEGLKVLGVEMAEHWNKYAKENYSIEILTGDFTKSEIKQRFDFITMFHVLEHIVDIPEAIKELGELLKDGGLIIIEVPYINGIGSILKGKNWSQLNPPNHINFFTKKGFRLLFHNAGFQIEKISTNSYNSQSIIQSFPKMLRWAATIFIGIFTFFGFGGNLRVYVKKKGK